MTRRDEQLDQPGGLAARQVRVDHRREEDGGDADDPRQPVDGELAQRVAGLGGQHEREVLVVAQLVGGGDDGAHQQVLEVGRRRRRAAVRRVKKSSSSRTRSASNSTSLPPGNRRYSVARDTPASAAMSSMVTLSMPHRSQHVLAASRTRSSTAVGVGRHE